MVGGRDAEHVGLNVDANPPEVTLWPMTIPDLRARGYQDGNRTSDAL
jgi:hypothetical protein